jgi:tetratricopeptide (TPR) repeat protein
MHVSLDQYLLVLRGVLPGELLLQQAHSHLLEVCATCRNEWDGKPAFDRPAASDGAWHLDGLAERRPPAERDFDLAHYEAEQRRQKTMRALARDARHDLARLRRQPMERWSEIVAGATKRFRSRAFLLLLLDEARAVVRNRPREAAALARLVPVALAASARRAAEPWAWDLRARAAAHHANALRVAGDLPGAERRFGELRRELRRRPLHTAAAEAEVRSLEASLCIDQRRFPEADRLLAAAARFASGDTAGRVAVQHAHLLMTVGDTDRALERFERAAAALDPAAAPVLHLSAVTGRVNCLSELGRFEEAERLLAEARAALPAGDGAGDAHLAALLCAYQARVDLGLGRLERAEAGFAAARDQLLALERDYDAVLASLDLAGTLLAVGKTTELRELAAELVPLFQARGVERETLAALRLLAEAAKTETLTAAAVAEIRGRLRSPAARPLAAPAEA